MKCLKFSQTKAQKIKGSRLVQEANHASRWFINSRTTLAFLLSYASHISFGLNHASLTNPFSPFYTPFTVPYEKIRIHLHEKANNCVKLHSLATKNDHLRANQIQ